MGHIHADTLNGVARREESRHSEKHDKAGESDCKVLAHGLSASKFLARHSRAPLIERTSLAVGCMARGSRGWLKRCLVVYRGIRASMVLGQIWEALMSHRDGRRRESG